MLRYRRSDKYSGLHLQMKMNHYFQSKGGSYANGLCVLTS